MRRLPSSKRRSIRFLSEFHSSKSPNFITEDDALSPYIDNIFDAELGQRRLHILEGIAKGEADINAGRCFTDREARDRLKIWFE